MLTDWNFWFSIITAIVAIVALLQTKQQIRMGNKQYLFDERVKYYLIAEGLIRLYENNKNHLSSEKDEPEAALDSKFLWMTNNTYLEKITVVIDHPLEKPSHKEFLIKLEDIKDVAVKVKFMFNGKSAILLGNFVLRYQELLFRMYQYQIFFKDMKESAEQFKWTLDEALEKMDEYSRRAELYEAVDNLGQAYDILKKENVEKRIMTKREKHILKFRIKEILQ